MKILSAGPAQNLVLTNSGAGRKPGVHLSDILKRMAFEKDKKYNPNDPISAMALECGFTWEVVLEQALAARHAERAGYRPDQMQEDGVWLSPDWVNEDADIQVEEWKATRKSSKNYEQKITEWGPQVKSYLRALVRRGLAKTLAVRFRVWFMVGDWSFENKGDLTLLKDYWDIDVEFDKRDLEENWSGVIAAGKRYGLLKDTPREDTWQKTPTTVKTKKSKSAAPAPSPAKARIVTFPSTKKSSRPRSGS